ncbi:predicted protein [Uncinocarpus reesii 1704]|uniref:Pentatricopeptide repeat protein n=1 Tax=Uncinocarpus reesii (strain UAMH 1704) TaxID=336963 RepID=C4JQ43_UNCRE|nr:uncharacterized protein UREG_03276 [Uncinocarpus reesii 1704]EEP78430.1 predicted protein [Uncinocarpus reesii 1704]
MTKPLWVDEPSTIGASRRGSGKVADSSRKSSGHHLCAIIKFAQVVGRGEASQLATKVTSAAGHDSRRAEDADWNRFSTTKMVKLEGVISLRCLFANPKSWSCSSIHDFYLLHGRAKFSIFHSKFQQRTASARQHVDIFDCERDHERDGKEDYTYNVAVTELENQSIASTCPSEYPTESSPLFDSSVRSLRDPSEPISDFIGPLPRPSKFQLDPLRLEFESDIGNSEKIGSKLLDDSRYKHDFGYWKELLDYRQRHYGDRGVVHIWKGLTERCAGLDLPVEGADADHLWKIFIAVAVKEERLMKEVQLYAEDLWTRTGKRWRHFYKEAVGAYFRQGRSRKAAEWHIRLKQVHFRWPNEILTVLPQALSAEGGLQSFRNICRDVEGHKIYGSVVPLLWNQGRIRDALAMHDFLMSRGDGPGAISEIEPLLKYVELYGSEKQYSYFARELVKAGIMRNGSPSDTETAPSEADKQTDTNSNPSKKVVFNDEFGARLFATKALTFDLILAGLIMFGVETIGPLTLREMAIRTRSVEELVSQLVALKRAKISTGESVFSKVVVKLAFGKSTKLLEDVLESDQHPDVFEDMRIQESLLATYTLAEDWRQVNKTLAIMSAASNEDPQNHNVLFRNAVRVGNWDAAKQQFETMREQGVHLSKMTILWLAREILPWRRRSHRPRKDRASVDALRRLIWIYQQVIISGGRVPPEAWTECIKRLGMYDLWDELEKLCFWIVPFYAPTRAARPGWVHSSKPPSLFSDGDAQSLERLLPTAHSSSPLRRIFSVRVQEAIIAWGFILRPHPDYRNRLLPNPFSRGEYLIPWVRGITLLRELRRKGVVVQTNTVKRACRARLATLFSNYRRSNRQRNRMLRRENPWSLNEILLDIRKAWGKPMFLEYGSDYRKLVNPRTHAVRPGRWTRRATEDFENRRQAGFSHYEGPG